MRHLMRLLVLLILATTAQAASTDTLDQARRLTAKFATDDVMNHPKGLCICHLGAFGGATGIVSLGVTSIGGLGSFSSSDCELPTYDLGGNRIAFHACYELPGATSWELVE